MTKYENLSKGQQRWVDSVLEIRPKLKDGGVITLKECCEIYNELYATRKKSGEKVGFPNWLAKTNKISRGVFAFPAPGVTKFPTAAAVAPAKSVKTPKQKTAKVVKAKTSKKSTEAFDKVKAELEAIAGRPLPIQKKSKKLKVEKPVNNFEEDPTAGFVIEEETDLDFIKELRDNGINI